MAGIVLKDESGNAVEYSGVTQFKVPYQDDDGNTAGTQKFTRMASLNAYAIIGSDVISGGYKVAKRLSVLPTDNAFMAEFSVEDCEEFGYESSGSHKLLVFLTPKRLTVGESYAYTDMY